MRLFFVEDMKQIIAKNIASLRQTSGMTQLELAEKLNYSDKAISKWERGDSIPDVIVLKTIADLFSVSLDYLLEEDHTAPQPVAEPLPENPACHHRNRKVVTVLSILIVWFVATLLYVILDASGLNHWGIFLPFVYAIPVTMIVWLVFNSIWFNQRRNYWIISLLMWTALASIVLTVGACGYWAWKLFVLGIPGQIAIYVWSRFQRKTVKA